ncbi:hypothetical protein LCGC14_2883320 [marine sediment metagenome]|uniref:Uncharacterized protein n=1 Tax=marine sediment metagenome TaxID=412755 RepID=A0A0F8XZG3_9ZZZZ
MSSKYSYAIPKVVGILRKVTTPQPWKCADCGAIIPRGDKCWKQGSKVICGCRFGSLVRK